MTLLAKADPTSVIVWSVVMLVLLIVGLAWATRLKRRYKEEDVPAPAMGFTLSDLRQMHRAGQLTDEEFAKAKDKIVLAAQKAAEKIPATTRGSVARDSAEAIRARRENRDAAGEPGHPAGE